MSRVTTLILYLVLFNFSAFIAGRYQKFMSRYPIINTRRLKLKRIVLIVFIMLPLILVQGFRLNTGTDYGNYLNIYGEIISGSFELINKYKFEPLFLLECFLLSKIWPYTSAYSATAFFLCNAILFNFIIFKVFDYYREKINMQLAYIIYYSVAYMMFWNIERQGMACLIVWYAIRYIHERNFKKYFLFILLACGFHSTSIIFILLYLLAATSNKNNRFFIKIIAGIVVALTPIILSLEVRLLSGKTSFDYWGDSGNQMKLSVYLYLAMFYIPTIFIFLFLRKRNKISLFDIKSRFSYHIIFMCDILSIIFMMSEGFILYGSRLCFFAYYGLIIGAASCVENIKNKLERIICIIYFWAAASIYFIRIYYVLGQGGVFPYSTVLNIL